MDPVEFESTGPAAAVEPAPAQAEASQSSQPLDGGAEPVQLFGKKSRKEREAAKKKKAADARARREATKAGKPRPAAEPEGAAEPTLDEWDEKQRTLETGGAWRLALRIVSLVLWPFGWRLDTLTEAECAEDVRLLAPLASRHRWLELAIRYAALPYLLAERIATKAKRREPKKAEPSP
jgi:hypothetical protein